MRFDHRDITSQWIELCAYGTAVMAAPVEQPAERAAPEGRHAAIGHRRLAPVCRVKFPDWRPLPPSMDVVRDRAALVE